MDARLNIYGLLGPGVTNGLSRRPHRVRALAEEEAAATR